MGYGSAHIEESERQFAGFLCGKRCKNKRERERIENEAREKQLEQEAKQRELELQQQQLLISQQQQLDSFQQELQDLALLREQQIAQELAEPEETASIAARVVKPENRKYLLIAGAALLVFAVIKYA